MNKVIVFTLLLCFFLHSASVFAAEPISITVNNIPVEFSEMPIEEDGRWFASINPVIMAIVGAEARTNSEEQTVTVLYQEKVTSFKADSTVIRIENTDGEVDIQYLDAAPKVINGEIFVPIRNVLEILGLTVESPQNNLVKITTPVRTIVIGE